MNNHLNNYFSKYDIATDGKSKRGIGRTARVTAISVNAALAANCEVPTSFPCLSTTSIPSSSSCILMSKTFSVEATQTAGSGVKRSSVDFVACEKNLAFWMPSFKPTLKKTAEDTAPR